MYLVISDLKEQNVFLSEKVVELEEIIANNSDKLMIYDDYFEKIHKTYEANKKYIENLVNSTDSINKKNQYKSQNEHEQRSINNIDNLIQIKDKSDDLIVESNFDISNLKRNKKHLLELDILKRKLNSYDCIEIIQNLKKINTALDVSLYNNSLYQK